ncbi:MAG: hypothetical protein ACRD1V_20435 [Vicinamibacterales bacterium]
MSVRSLGFLAGAIGSALGVWWWTTQYRGANRQPLSIDDRGVVIFRNTPAAADGA